MLLPGIHLQSETASSAVSFDGERHPALSVCNLPIVITMRVISACKYTSRSEASESQGCVFPCRWEVVEGNGRESNRMKRQRRRGKEEDVGRRSQDSYSLAPVPL